VNELTEPKNEEELNVQPRKERAVWHVLNARFVLEAAEKFEIQRDVNKARFPSGTNVHKELHERWEIIEERWAMYKFNNENMPEILSASHLKSFTNWATKSYAGIGKLNATVIINVLTN
jgi:hypothetical protein